MPAGTTTPTSSRSASSRAIDGRDKIQMRIDLGLIQMELNGRPDGRRVGELESLLDALEAQARAAEANGESFALDTDTCRGPDARGAPVLSPLPRRLPSPALRPGRPRHRAEPPPLRLRGPSTRPGSATSCSSTSIRPYVIMMHTRAQAAQVAGPQRLRGGPDRRSTRESRGSAPSSASTASPSKRPSASSSASCSGSAARSRRNGRSARSSGSSSSSTWPSPSKSTRRPPGSATSSSGSADAGSSGQRQGLEPAALGFHVGGIP